MNFWEFALHALSTVLGGIVAALSGYFAQERLSQRQWKIEYDRAQEELKVRKRMALAAVHDEIGQIIIIFDCISWKHFLDYLPTDHWQKYQDLFRESGSEYAKRVNEGYAFVLLYNRKLNVRSMAEEVSVDLGNLSQKASDALRAAQEMEPKL